MGGRFGYSSIVKDREKNLPDIQLSREFPRDRPTLIHET